MVALLDENSASDGDIFPAMFREAGLGPLIGKRSWGGVVGITNRGQLIDGGAVNVPESGFASKTGEWIIEGYGVDPDIEVDNDPQSVIAGKDPQLERAIVEVMAKLKQPVKLPPKPAGPVKTINRRETQRRLSKGITRCTSRSQDLHDEYYPVNPVNLILLLNPSNRSVTETSNPSSTRDLRLLAA